MKSSIEMSSSMVFPLTAANLVTLVRLGLTFFFAGLLWYGQSSLAITIFALAWGLDALDGWLARRLHQVTRTGYVVDKVVDRLLLVGGGVLFVALGYLPAAAALLLLKDFFALPASAIEFCTHRPITDLGYTGKIVTVLQGAAILWLLLVGTQATLIISIVATLGGAAGLRHLYRTLA